MTVYYNEHDPEAAAWLRELGRRGLIAPGDVDERDIRDVVPAELFRYRQCHLFAGVGVWSYALRQAGWPDDWRVWTGSCPCQPFSAAGKGAGFADERHLWPAWFHLIGQCRPGVILGEQVASSDSAPWVDLVHSDLEALGYAFGPIVLPAAGFGAPHGRHRIFFVAESGGERPFRTTRLEAVEDQYESDGRISERGRNACELADSESRLWWSGKRHRERRTGIRRGELPTGGHGSTGVMGDPSGEGLERRPGEQCDDGSERATPERAGGPVGGTADPGRVGPVNGFWFDAEWLPCRDGKARPVRPGTFQLVAGLAGGLVPGGDSGVSILATSEARAMRLKGYGNGLCAPAAEAVIRAYMESRSFDD